jgi:hypothetical protein
MMWAIYPGPVTRAARYWPPESGVSYSIPSRWVDPLFTPPNATTHKMQTVETAWPHPEAGVALIIPRRRQYQVPGQVITVETGQVPEGWHVLGGEMPTGYLEPPKPVKVAQAGGVLLGVALAGAILYQLTS